MFSQKIFMMMVKEIQQKECYQDIHISVQNVYNGQEGIKAIKDGLQNDVFFNLVICDYMMPIMNGE